MRIGLLIIGLVLAACSHTPIVAPVKEAPAVAPAKALAKAPVKVPANHPQVTIIQNRCNQFSEKAAVSGFSAFDKDKSKSVLREEYLCLVGTGFTALNKNHDEYLSADELPNGAEWIKTADRNSDSRISVVEFMTTAGSAFTAADSDSNGSLSEEEFKKAEGKLP